MKKYHLLFAFSFLFALAVSMVIASAPAVAATTEETAVENDECISVPTAAGDGWSGDGNNLDLSNIQKGDIILTGRPPANIIGQYGHAAMYIGNDQMVEAWFSGIRTLSVSANVHNTDIAAIYRVSTSSSIKTAAQNFALSKLGRGYDYFLAGKQVYGNKYYCSELCWASYKAVGGPDIDKNPGFHFNYMWGVAPQEIADDGNTYQIAYSA